MPQLNHAEDAAVVARKLIASLVRPFDIDGQELSISTSIGIALHPGDGNDVDQLLKHADTAMYDAKSAGRNDFRFFTQDTNSRACARLTLARMPCAVPSNAMNWNWTINPSGPCRVSAWSAWRPLYAESSGKGRIPW
ncbi:MAG: GGDEF domain-containing protein [Zoogloea sp.]|nr:GGDEF domain-containing protein [Zoogloea sp.]